MQPDYQKTVFFENIITKILLNVTDTYNKDVNQNHKHLLNILYREIDFTSNTEADIIIALKYELIYFITHHAPARIRTGA